MVDVTSWADLDNVRNDLAADYTLTADLDSTSAGYDTYASSTANSGAGWAPIDNFTGTFDGNGHSISDLFIDRTVVAGLFGASMSGTVSNLSVLDADMTTTATAAGVVCARVEGSVTNCHATGAVSGDIQVGGLVGLFDGVTISGCSADVDVTAATNEAGGFAGSIRGAASATECWSDGSATAPDRVGGFVGVERDADTTIDNCYTTATVDGQSATDSGGFIGRQRDATTVRIDKCYAANPTLTNVNGGFAGQVSDGAVVADSFWDEELSGLSTSAGGTGKTTAQMQDLTTYTDTATTGLDTAWSMADVSTWTTETWRIDDGVSYPELGWEVETVTVDLSWTSSVDSHDGEKVYRETSPDSTLGNDPTFPDGYTEIADLAANTGSYTDDSAPGGVDEIWYAVTAYRTADVDGESGAVTAAATIGAETGIADLAGTGDVVATGTVTAAGSAALAGTGDIAASGTSSPLPVTDGLIGHYGAAQLSLTDGDPVETWPDESPLGADASQATAAMQPTYRANGFASGPSVEFDGADDALVAPFTTGMNAPEHTIFILFRTAMDGTDDAIGVLAHKQTATSDRNYWFAIDNGFGFNTVAGSLGYRMSAGGTASNLETATDHRDDTAIIATGGNDTAADQDLRIDGTSADSVASPGSAEGDGEDLWIGNEDATTRHFAGHIGAIIAYDRPLSEAERSDVRAYLTETYLSTTTVETGIADLAGTGDLVGSGTETGAGVGALAGAGAVAATGTGVAVGAGVLAGAGSVTAAGVAVGTGTATLDGAGDLASAGVITRPGVAALAGAGDVAAAGIDVSVGIGALAGAGDLVGVGTVPAAVIEGIANLAGAGDVAANGVHVQPGTSTLEGAGDLVGAGTRATGGTAVLEGAGDLASVGTDVDLGAGTLAGSGDLIGAGTGTLAGVGALDGVGDLAAIGSVGGIITGVAALGGVGSVFAEPTKIGTGVGVLSGTGDLVGVGVKTVPGTAALSGVGDLLGAGTGVGIGSSILEGAGNVVADGTVVGVGVIVTGAATLEGIGDLVADATVTIPGSAILDGAGDLVGVGSIAVPGASSLSGAGDLAGAGVGASPGVATLEGAGTVAATGTRTSTAAVILDGEGDIVALGTVSGVLGVIVEHPIALVVENEASIALSRTNAAAIALTRENEAPVDIKANTREN